MAAGRRLVQVGFMRRYDAGVPGDEGRVDAAAAIGAPLLMHCAHRNPSVPGHYVHREMIITDTRRARDRHRPLAVRRGDRRRPRVLTPRRSRPRHRPAGPADPLLRDGQRRARRRRDRRSTHGTATTSAARSSARTAPSPWPTPARWSCGREGGFAGRVPADWRERFVRAYDVELQDWVDAVAAGLVRPGRAPGTATPPPSRPTPPSRRCAPATRWSSGSARHRRSTPTGRADDRRRRPRGPDRGPGRCRPVPGAARPARRRPHVREVPRRHGDQRGRRARPGWVDGPRSSPRSATTGSAPSSGPRWPASASTPGTSARPPTCTRRSCSAS